MLRQQQQFNIQWQPRYENTVGVGRGRPIQMVPKHVEQGRTFFNKARGRAKPFGMNTIRPGMAGLHINDQNLDVNYGNVRYLGPPHNVNQAEQFTDDIMQTQRVTNNIAMESVNANPYNLSDNNLPQTNSSIYVNNMRSNANINNTGMDRAHDNTDNFREQVDVTKQLSNDDNLFRWFKFTLKPPYSRASERS